MTLEWNVCHSRLDPSLSQLQNCLSQQKDSTSTYFDFLAGTPRFLLCPELARLRLKSLGGAFRLFLGSMDHFSTRSFAARCSLGLGISSGNFSHDKAFKKVSRLQKFAKTITKNCDFLVYCVTPEHSLLLANVCLSKQEVFLEYRYLERNLNSDKCALVKCNID